MPKVSTLFSLDDKDQTIKLVQQDAGTVILLCFFSFLDLGQSLLANVRTNGVQGFFCLFLF